MVYVREQTVEGYLIARVKASGGFTRKVVWQGRRGAPDRLCGWPELGNGGFVETKPPAGYDNQAHQEREQKRLRACGFRVDVLSTKDAVDTYVLEMTTR
jgi:hypothetical protein